MSRRTMVRTACAWLWSTSLVSGSVAQTLVPGAAGTTGEQFELQQDPGPGGQAPTVPPEKPSVRLVFDDHPELRVGDAIRVEFRLKLQGDVRSFSPAPASEPDEFDVPLARVGIEGRVTRYVEYEVAYELTDSQDGWRSVFVNLRPIDLFQVQGGHFKVPFSRERLTGPTNLDFTQRAAGVRLVAPGYDTGLMAHGRLDKRLLTYAVGVFEGTADETEPRPEPPGLTPLQDNPEQLVAWRVTARPVVRLQAAGWLRPLEFGVNGTHSQVDEGRYGWQGEAAFGDEIFDSLYVNGRRTRLGVDASIESGPVHLQAEWLRGRDERRGQGMESDNLPEVEVRDWYVSGTVVLTGEARSDVERPARPLFGGGAGSLEAAVRFERLSFGSAADTGEPPSTSPRSANVLGNLDTIWTVGLNWYPVRHVRMQVDAVHERFDDPLRTPLAGHDTFWSWVVRLQFAL